jgi:hypothetical protein
VGLVRLPEESALTALSADAVQEIVVSHEEGNLLAFKIILQQLVKVLEKDRDRSVTNI